MALAEKYSKGAVVQMMAVNSQLRLNMCTCQLRLERWHGSSACTLPPCGLRDHTALSSPERSALAASGLNSSCWFLVSLLVDEHHPSQPF